MLATGALLYLFDQLPDYSDGQAGAKRARYEERARYEADEEQAGTVTFSLISTSFFTAKVP